jgi:class 3 adenylate cyclase/tetratricopeptide (TPR) repeat protein
MKCPSCQHDNPPAAKFCLECGGRLSLTCPKCGVPLPPSAKFCLECGAQLGGGAPSASGLTTNNLTTDNLSPRAYTPKHLADKILQSRSALEGERKQVTILFADVKGSMELTSQVDAEEWHRILDRFFQILAEGVHRFEGTVNQYTGDGIMALFGAPVAHEDHARRACYAALHLLDALRGYANELRLRRGLSFSARLGLNSGDVIVGKIGDDLRMDYTAQGHTVGLAARMEQIAEPGKVYLTGHTAALVQGYFALADLGEMDIKGVQGAMHVYELQGLGQMRTRLDVSRSRGFSRFVGRGDEMQVLESALTRARDGHAQIVGIVGDAGLGKSRLCYEFLERCRARGLMTYETTGVAHGKAIPFLPVLRLFRAFYGITEQDSAATARERIAGRLLLLDERLRESLPLNFDFMGVPDPENPAPRIDPEARQRQMFDIVRRVIQARGQKETTITLLEDLHWFDGGSAVFLEPLLDAVVGTRALVLVNFRPEYQAPWMGRSYYHQLPLAPLGPDAIRELLDALLGKDRSIAGLAEMIHTRTGGNPFFTEEVVQNLIESGKLQGSKGAYHLITPVDKLEVPSSVHALLAARIDRLAEREKDVLQTAAVIGREFDEPTLAAVVEQDAPQLREALQTLKDTEFVYEQSLYPVAEYLFKHPLTQEVALASQLQERRRKLHAAVARVIEAAHAHDLDQQAALLAHHWEEAADLGQAVRWHRRAAEWAGASDPIEGMRHWRKVRELGGSLQDPDVKESRLLACRFILASGTWRFGMSEDEMHGLLDEGRALAQELDRPAATAAMLVGVAAHLGVHGRAEAALEVAEEASGMIRDGMALSEMVAIETGRAYWLMIAGRLPQALAAFDRIIECSAGDPHVGRAVIGYSPLIWAETLAAWALAMMGRFDECWPRAERAIRIAREHRTPENLGWALGVLAQEAHLAGGTSRLPVADLCRACVEGLEIAEAVGSRYSQIIASYSLAIAHFLNGDSGTSEERFADALGQARAAGTALDSQAYNLAVFADASRARGDAEAAIARAREGIEVADAGGARFQAALARTALADALIYQGAPEQEVAPVIAAARELARMSGADSLLPRLRTAEARLAGRNDRAVLAAGLREAEAMYRTMGAPDPAERLAEEIRSLGCSC